MAIPPKALSVAGTKDKRGITVQTVCVYKVSPDRIRRMVLNKEWYNKGLFISTIRQKRDRLMLGSLKGNNFRIVLRNVSLDLDNWKGIDNPMEGEGGDAELLRKAAHVTVSGLARDGFVNYFGMQRFGTWKIPTYLIGAALLDGEWEQAVRLILGGDKKNNAEDEDEKEEAENEDAEKEESEKETEKEEEEEDEVEKPRISLEQEERQFNNGAKRKSQNREEGSGKKVKLLDEKGSDSKSTTVLLNSSEKASCVSITPRIGQEDFSRKTNWRKTPSRMSEQYPLLREVQEDLTHAASTETTFQVGETVWETFNNTGRDIEETLRLYRKQNRHIPIEFSLLKALKQQQDRHHDRRGNNKKPLDNKTGNSYDGYTKSCFLQAIVKLPRSSLSMYIHAAQSLVFNFAATERLQRYGRQPVVGDFVPKKAGGSTRYRNAKKDEIHMEEEMNYEEQMETVEDEKDVCIETVKEIESEREALEYTIFDVLLPLPGDIVEIPKHMKSCYERVAREKLGLDLYHHFKSSRYGLGMLPGSYRPVVSRPTDVKWKLMNYDSDGEVLLQSDVDRLRLSGENTKLKDEGWGSDDDDTKISSNRPTALLLQCSLRKASYLTMALREILTENDSILSERGGSRTPYTRHSRCEGATQRKPP